MKNERNNVHDIAEEGLDRIIEGDKEKGQRMIDEAKKRDPKAVDDLVEEIENEKEQAERFISKK